LSVDEILISMESLDSEEREKVLMLVKEKYNLTNKLPRNVFIANSGYEFWLNEDDDIYDNPKRSSTNSKQNNLYS
jgi:hypothetical protein